MNKLTSEINALLVPRAALIAYSDKGSTNYFLELHEISNNGKMGEAIPLTYEFMNDIAKNYSESHSGTPSGILPESLLYADTRKGREKYIWYNHPGKRMMYFHKDLNIENAEYNLPGIIYLIQREALEVYAYKGSKPTSDCGLFLAPFFNVSEASVCLGSAKLERPKNLSYVDLIAYWEKRFWLTEFSHLGSGGNPTKSNLVLVTKAAQKNSFDVNELRPLNKTLKDILR